MVGKNIKKNHGDYYLSLKYWWLTQFGPLIETPRPWIFWWICNMGVVTHLLTAGYDVRDPSLAEVVTCLPLSIHPLIKAHSHYTGNSTRGPRGQKKLSLFRRLLIKGLSSLVDYLFFDRPRKQICKSQNSCWIKAAEVRAADSYDSVRNQQKRADKNIVFGNAEFTV